MRLTLFLCTALFIVGCEESVEVRKNVETVFANAETNPVKSADDSADDPAIWIHPQSPEESLILGTDKKNGLAIYNLEGKEVQFIDRGRLNNVDLRQNILLGDGKATLAVATNRSEKSLDIFKISAEGQVSFVQAQPVDLSDPYGTCMYLDQSGSAHVFANSKDGEYQHWQLTDGESIAPKFIGKFKLDLQPEGCVVNDATATLYFGEEEKGLWKMPADTTGFDERTLIDDVSSGNLVADVEGMDIYYGTDGKNILVVSSQGDYSYALYDISDNSYLGSFRIADNGDKTIDGAEETDGLAVTSSHLGVNYSAGLLVVQDGFNRLPKENQNFKLVSWEQIEKIITP